MAAKGIIYPWQRLENLEGHIEARKEDFIKTFFNAETQVVQHVGFMSHGLIVQVMDNMSGHVTFEYVQGKLFKRWLQGY